MSEIVEEAQAGNHRRALLRRTLEAYIYVFLLRVSRDRVWKD